MGKVILFPTPKPQTAQAIIAKMITLNELRYQARISRRTYLTRYRQLRYELEATEEYIIARLAVKLRSKGICEKCRKAPAVHMCHKKRMATHPNLALATSNLYDGCKTCHQQDHPEFRLRA